MIPEPTRPPFAKAQTAQRNKAVTDAEGERRIQEGNRTKAAARLGPSTLNLGGLLPRHARYRGSHPALVVAGRTFTFRELNVYVNRLANALLGAGLRKGDKFATILPNCLELMASYWAAAKTGLVIVPVSPLLLATGLQTLLRDSELTRAAMADGLLHTGDAGYLDEDGYLFLVDRIKDMIISGGVNVYPHDIEEVVVRHPAVRETAVFGAPDEKWGDVPIAAVVAKEGASIDRAELIAWTNARVDAKFQRIHDVVIYQEFPRNAAGKTLKREMRATFAAARQPGP